MFFPLLVGERAKRAKPHTNWSKWKIAIFICYTIDIRGFTGLETPNELHNRGALTDAHAHAALIILIVVKRDQYSLLSRQLK